MTDSSKTLQVNDWLLSSTTSLARSGIVSARLDGELLAEYVLEKSRTWLHAHGEYRISKTEQKQLETLLARRLSQEPIAYILGSKEFYGRDYVVKKDVLVPRPESEDFIEVIKSLEKNKLKFIDIGTGSGILAITTALEQPSWSGVATDFSPKALNVAKQNAEKLKAKNLVFKVQNLLVDDAEKYDVVIANLPYVPKNLHGKPDIANEPEIALFADEDGLALYQDLFQQIAERNSKPTHVLTESLLDQHFALKNMAKRADYRLIQTKGLVQHFVLNKA